MKKIILFFALIAFAAACASEKKQANASEGNGNGSTSHVVIGGSNTAETTTTTAEVEADKIYIEETNADGTTKTFEDVLAAYKGKVIYVDFWATWCPPCRGEMPSSQKLHSQFEGKDVVFLYVAFERGTERAQKEAGWKKGIDKMDIKGVHFLPSNEANQGVSQKYNINSIPRYMLVDKTGKVVNQDAPRPSSGQVIAGLIEQYL
ncbi:TlpA family protein disulfide reductase [Bernardetia sp.]|uniref:TlpA family protein disulfide reductase n=1 Tax=Bernardetia sp. TaxID=1937974 RepID=UPI0025C395FC|nr:TlpA disulfide reductase family protein [Bernardetia sp.]